MSIAKYTPGDSRPYGVEKANLSTKQRRHNRLYTEPAKSGTQSISGGGGFSSGVGGSGSTSNMSAYRQQGQSSQNQGSGNAQYSAYSPRSQSSPVTTSTSSRSSSSSSPQYAGLSMAPDSTPEQYKKANESWQNYLNENKTQQQSGGGMEYAGGSKYFDESTGQYTGGPNYSTTTSSTTTSRGGSTAISPGLQRAPSSGGSTAISPGLQRAPIGRLAQGFAGRQFFDPGFQAMPTSGGGKTQQQAMDEQMRKLAADPRNYRDSADGGQYFDPGLQAMPTFGGGGSAGGNTYGETVRTTGQFGTQVGLDGVNYDGNNDDFRFFGKPSEDVIQNDERQRYGKTAQELYLEENPGADPSGNDFQKFRNLLPFTHGGVTNQNYLSPGALPSWNDTIQSRRYLDLENTNPRQFEQLQKDKEADRQERLFQETGWRKQEFSPEVEEKMRNPDWDNLSAWHKELISMQEGRPIEDLIDKGEDANERRLTDMNQVPPQGGTPYGGTNTTTQSHYGTVAEGHQVPANAKDVKRMEADGNQVIEYTTPDGTRHQAFLRGDEAPLKSSYQMGDNQEELMEMASQNQATLGTDVNQVPPEGGTPRSSSTQQGTSSMSMAGPLNAEYRAMNEQERAHHKRMSDIALWAAGKNNPNVQQNPTQRKLHEDRARELFGTTSGPSKAEMQEAYNYGTQMNEIAEREILSQNQNYQSVYNVGKEDDISGASYMRQGQLDALMNLGGFSGGREPMQQAPGAEPGYYDSGQGLQYDPKLQPFNAGLPENPGDYSDADIELINKRQRDSGISHLGGYYRGEDGNVYQNYAGQIAGGEDKMFSPTNPYKGGSRMTPGFEDMLAQMFPQRFGTQQASADISVEGAAAGQTEFGGTTYRGQSMMQPYTAGGGSQVPSIGDPAPGGGTYGKDQISYGGGDGENSVSGHGHYRPGYGPKGSSTNPYGFAPPKPGMAGTQATVPYHNPTTGETWTAPSGGFGAPPGWVEGEAPPKAYAQPSNSKVYDPLLEPDAPFVSYAPGYLNEDGTFNIQPVVQPKMSQGDLDTMQSQMDDMGAMFGNLDSAPSGDELPDLEDTQSQYAPVMTQTTGVSQPTQTTSFSTPSKTTTTSSGTQSYSSPSQVQYTPSRQTSSQSVSQSRSASAVPIAIPQSQPDDSAFYGYADNMANVAPRQQSQPAQQASQPAMAQSQPAQQAYNRPQSAPQQSAPQQQQQAQQFQPVTMNQQASQPQAAAPQQMQMQPQYAQDNTINMAPGSVDIDAIAQAYGAGSTYGATTGLEEAQAKQQQFDQMINDYQGPTANYGMVGGGSTTDFGDAMAQRDAFINRINEARRPAFANPGSGQGRNLDFGALLEQAGEDVQGGFQNPFSYQNFGRGGPGYR